MSGLVLLQPGDGHGYGIGQAALLPSSDLPQAQQIAHPVSSGDVLLFEPSTLRTTNSQGRSGAHGAPVENAEEESSTRGEQKANIIFALFLPVAGATLLGQPFNASSSLLWEVPVDRPGVFRFLDSCTLGVVSTLAADGAPQSALVGIAVTPELEIVFDTVEKSRKFGNLMRDARASLVAGWQGEVTVQLEGTARRISSTELGPHHEAYFRKFPDGPARLKWEGIAYFVIAPRWLRYSDYNQNPAEISEFGWG